MHPISPQKKEELQIDKADISKQINKLFAGWKKLEIVIKVIRSAHDWARKEDKAARKVQGKEELSAQCDVDENAFVKFHIESSSYHGRNVWIYVTCQQLS